LRAESNAKRVVAPSRRIPAAVACYGERESRPREIELRAGPVSLIYTSGEIRYIRLGEREIVRRIYVTVRDEHWATILPVISNLRLDAGADWFELSFDAVQSDREVDFAWRGTVTGGQSGAVAFCMDGEARSSFRQCRVGICVLHPIRELAGMQCQVEKTDGTVCAGEFPFYVSPHQPFTDIRSITHPVTNGIGAAIRFEGGVFEMEDQRNWTDGSYKTYSPPLSLPYPSEIQRLSKLRQKVTIALVTNATPSPDPRVQREVVVTVERNSIGRLPRLGMSFASDCPPMRDDALARIREMNIHHLRVDLVLSEPGYPRLLERAKQEARSIGALLEIALFLSDDLEGELAGLADLLNTLTPAVCSWIVIQRSESCTSGECLRAARRHLEKYEAAAPIVTGSHMNFTELNRNRAPVELADAICYPVTPQVHGTDDATLVEALEAQAWTAASAKQWANERPIFITPITLRPQSVGRPAAPNGLPDNVDLRQMSLLNGAWTLGSIKQLSEAGVESVTYFETQGWRGIQHGGNIPESSVFESLPGSVFPAYHVLADLCDFADGEVLVARSTRPLQVEAIALKRRNELRILCGNFTALEQSVKVVGVNGRALVYLLNAENADLAMFEPERFRKQRGEPIIQGPDGMQLTLTAYSVARLDIEVTE
jgi:hypothetical protein